VDDQQVPPIRLKLSAGPDGTLAGISMNGNPLADFNDLQKKVVELVGTGRGPDSLADKTEVEMDCDFGLNYADVVRAITAVSGTVQDGQVVELIGVTRDISDRKVLESELTRLAATDPVTGVWNRHHGTALLVTETAQGDGPRKPLSVLMVDIDNFKAINDSFGHQVGDEVLVEVARRLIGAVRSTDMVARWGGEEFVVLLRDCALDHAVERAEEIRRQIADPIFPGVGTVTVSVGAAQLTGDEDVTSLLGRADEALYEAKRAGRNTVVAGERR
jgi:diguanylate cyclase (GGDEF)-like protein